MLSDEFRRIMASLEQSRFKTPCEVANLPMFRQLLGRVSDFCLRDLHSTYIKVCKGDFLPECVNCFVRSSTGLPCAHEVTSIMREGRVFLLTDVHVFWRELDWFGVQLSGPDEPVEINENQVDVTDLQQAIDQGTLDENQVRQLGNT